MNLVINIKYVLFKRIAGHLRDIFGVRSGISYSDSVGLIRNQDMKKVNIHFNRREGHVLFSCWIIVISADFGPNSLE